MKPHHNAVKCCCTPVQHRVQKRVAICNLVAAVPTDGSVVRRLTRVFATISMSHITRLQLYTQGKIMFQMSVLPCLSVHWITVSSSRNSQFLCICQVLFKSSGQIYSSHIGSKIVSCFWQIVSLYCWDTYKMCAKIWGVWIVKNQAFYHTEKNMTTTWNRGQNLFSLTRWLGQLNLQLSSKMVKRVAKCKSDL